MTCQHCAAAMTGRKRKYCDKVCADRAYNARRKADGRLRAYNQRQNVKQRNRERLHDVHYTQTFDCERCGTNHTNRRGEQARYCGRVCAQVTCVVPATHPARWFGDQCQVEYTDCAWCGRLLCRNDRLAARTYCSDSCSWRAKAERRRSRETAYPNDTWTWAQFVQLIARLGWRCVYCDEPFAAGPQPDHVIALSRGGRNRLANIVPSCGPCNADKRQLSLSDWAAERARLGKPPRHTDLQFPHLFDLAA